MAVTYPEKTGIPDGGVIVLAHSNTQIPFTADGGSAGVETVLATITIPGGVMGPNDSLEITSLWTGWAAAGIGNTPTGNVRPRIRLGGTSGTVFQDELGAMQSYQFLTIIHNDNSVSAQKSFPSIFETSIARAATVIDTGAEDTSVDIDLVFSAQVTVSGESLNLESYSVKLVRAR